MALPDAQREVPTSPRLLPIIIGGIVILGLIVAGVVYSARTVEETKAVTAYDRQSQLVTFQAFVRDRIGADLVRAGQSFGVCKETCETFWPDAGAVKALQYRTADAIVVAFLFAEWDMANKYLQYRIKLQWSSTRDDGDLAPVAPQLQQVVESILKRYNFPPQYFWPTPNAFVERGNSTYSARFSAYSKALNYNRIYHHPGAEKLRGERVANITRVGPFTEEGSWLREK